MKEKVLVSTWRGGISLAELEAATSPEQNCLRSSRLRKCKAIFSSLKPASLGWPKRLTPGDAPVYAATIRP